MTTLGALNGFCRTHDIPPFSGSGKTFYCGRRNAPRKPGYPQIPLLHRPQVISSPLRTVRFVLLPAANSCAAFPAQVLLVPFGVPRARNRGF